MSDLISRQAAITEAHNIIKGYAGYKAWAIVDMLRKLPSADVVEVVRCRDCARYDTHDKRCRYWNHGVGVDLNEYCSRAERRTDGEEV